MKKASAKTILSALLLSVIFVACNNVNNETKNDKKISGKIIEVSSNYISITTEQGDTLTYSTYETDKDKCDKVFMEDSVLVTYSFVNGVATVSDIVVISHNASFINNISAMLVGTWNNNDTTNIDNPNKLVFKTDSTLEIITTNNKECLKWYIDAFNIMTHDTISTNNISVIRVDNNILTIRFDNSNIVKFEKVEI